MSALDLLCATGRMFSHRQHFSHVWKTSTCCKKVCNHSGSVHKSCDPFLLLFPKLGTKIASYAFLVNWSKILPIFGQLTEHGDRDLLRHWVAHAVVRCAGVPGDTVQYSTVQYRDLLRTLWNFAKSLWQLYECVSGSCSYLPAWEEVTLWRARELLLPLHGGVRQCRDFVMIIY